MAPWGMKPAAHEPAPCAARPAVNMTRIEGESQPDLSMDASNVAGGAAEAAGTGRATMGAEVQGELLGAGVPKEVCSC
eukprot:COSAG01_NODE_3622_length_5858_cov_1194.967187_8_plen_78_part_00